MKLNSIIESHRIEIINFSIDIIKKIEFFLEKNRIELEKTRIKILTRRYIEDKILIHPGSETLDSIGELKIYHIPLEDGTYDIETNFKIKS